MCEGCLGVWERWCGLGVCLGHGLGCRGENKGNCGDAGGSGGDPAVVGVSCVRALVFPCALVCGLGGQTDCASRLFFIPWTPLSFFPVSGLMKTYLRKGIWLIFQNRVWAERWRHRGGQETAGGDPGRVLLLFFLIGGATAELPCAAKLWPGENKRAPRACSWCSPQVP